MAEAPASPGGCGSHDSGDQSPRSNVREQDRYLPIANISRIMKKALPANGKIAKDAKETVQECVSEFISFITSECVSFFLYLFMWLYVASGFWSNGKSNFVGRVISVWERRGRRLTAMIYFGQWRL